MKVDIDGAFGETGGLGNVVYGGSVEALSGEYLSRGSENLRSAKLSYDFLFRFLCQSETPK
jgi:hypothetical protein